jgi:hypothetical protein
MPVNSLFSKSGISMNPRPRKYISPTRGGNRVDLFVSMNPRPRNSLF